MESRAEQAVASPRWGDREERRKVAPRPVRGSAGPGLGGSTALDAGVAALMLGGTAALWAAFLLAVW